MGTGASEVVAIDYETYYSNECSVKGNTPTNYVKHPEFDAYLVAIWCPSFQYVGNPRDFDWKKIDGRTVVAHNASFDEAVTIHLMDTRVIPRVDLEWHCTADLSVSMQAPRSLAGACFALLGKTLSKGVRDRLKDHSWKEVVAQGWEKEVTDYALDDAEYCWRIWDGFNDQWSDQERALSNITRAMGRRGVRVNRKLLDSSISCLDKIVFDTEAQLPWCNELDSKYNKEYPPTSTRGLAATCAKHGIDPPASTAEDSDERRAWEARYGARYPFIRHMLDWRKANKHLKTLKTIRNRLLDDDSMPYGLKYYGAEVTGRWSGDAGFNTQNMPRQEQFGVNIRQLFIPRKGKKFVIADFSQIEPRCMALLTGDGEFLRAIAHGMSPYEVHARQSMNWQGGELSKEDKDLYLLAKVRVLSLGYGASWQSFVRSAANYGASHLLRTPSTSQDVSMFRAYLRKMDHRHNKGLQAWFDNATADERNESVNAFKQVEDYRKSNPKVVGLWRKLDHAFRKSSSESKYGSQFIYKLPSGRSLRYFNIHKKTAADGGGWACFTQKKDSDKYNRFRYMFGSRIVENACQGLARDIFAECLVRLWNAGFHVVLQIHDEVVIEVDEDTAKQASKDILKMMSVSPQWAKTFPVSASAEIADFYKK